ncbi:hypothetical protein AWH56_002760 [Anaerobacillus isosaccharinicus]|uniref:Uncharacterized protein n=1 Tax=Anaerobacillus isosaccharinicus TaxID=1532552 RepID=A0A1S2M752_9BACI|nr:hypothetical protein [Anaerobacillus isosaccharinicus]MBA5585035.1 hypothetical protein [Anaerobacillus isosaccharinicus]QOY36614.1 hypothetical protein AWH56_002760 [Anaerobacillus isosaccharinicus]
MIIELDGYFHQVLLTGKKCSKQQLKQKYLEAKNLTTDIKDLPALFCSLHKFEVLSNDEHIKVDYVIDTDTDRIYSPSY